MMFIITKIMNKLIEEIKSKKNVYVLKNISDFICDYD